MIFGMLISLVLLICVLFYAFMSFDRLLKMQYQRYHQCWIADGKPAGFFWRASECDFILSQFSRLRLTFSWIFSTPKWAAGCYELLAILKRLRLAVIIWNLGILSWFFALQHVIQK
jgi:hypothetical protein